jgi:ribosomal protein L24E
VVSAAPHEYSWNFQTYARRQIEPLGEGAFRIRDDAAALMLCGECAESTLQTSITPTEVVWAYHNENNDEKFRHIEYSVAGHAAVRVEFSIGW